MAKYQATLVYGEIYYLKGQLFKRDEPQIVDEATMQLLLDGAVYDEKVTVRVAGADVIESRQKCQFTIEPLVDKVSEKVEAEGEASANARGRGRNTAQASE